MKIRTSFVANSSSASFVLTVRADRGDFFRRFDLTILNFVEARIGESIPQLEKFVKEYDRDKTGKDIRYWYNEEMYDRDRKRLGRMQKASKQLNDNRYGDGDVDKCTPEWFRDLLDLVGVKIDWHTDDGIVIGRASCRERV